MPEINDVVPDEVIDDVWGNQIRDRSIQRYDDRSTRSSEHSSPANGDVSYLEDEKVVEFYDGAAWQGLVPIGSIVMTGRASAPSGWLLCQGQAVSRTTYASLFSAISTTYGVGDGSTTFNLPDLQQRFPMGKAASGTGQNLGDTGGSINHNHSVSNHTHSTNPPSTNTSNTGSHAHSQSSTGSSGGHSHSLGSGHALIGLHSNSLRMKRIQISSWTYNVIGINISQGNTSTTTPYAVQLGGSSGNVGNHNHTNPNVNSNGGHSHSVNLPATTSSASGSGNTGSGNPPFVTVNFMIKH